MTGGEKCGTPRSSIFTSASNSNEFNSTIPSRVALPVFATKIWNLVQDLAGTGLSTTSRSKIDRTAAGSSSNSEAPATMLQIQQYV